MIEPQIWDKIPNSHVENPVGVDQLAKHDASDYNS
jgi:hypothetical protein